MTAQTRIATRLRTYLRPVLALCIAAPLWTYAAVRSLDWFAHPFPGFFVMLRGTVPTVSGMDWPADKAALFHSQVIAVDGQPITGADDVYARAAASPSGTKLHYSLRKRGETFERSVESRTFTATDYLQTHGILLFFGLICLASGIIVGFLQPHLRAARVYLLQAMVTGLYASSAVYLHRPGFPMLGLLCPILECFFAATWIHFSMVFPIERFAGRRRWWLGLPYIVSAIQAATVVHGLLAEPPDVGPLYRTYTLNALSLLCFIGALILAYREGNDPLPRLRVKAILAGAMISLPWPALAFLDNTLSGRAVPVQLALVLTPLGYASLGYAIVKHDMFDIDRVVRQTFTYTLLSLVVIGAYALLLGGSARFLPVVGEQQALLSMVFVLVLAFALEPLRRGVQNLVDRAFYRGRLNYRATLRGLTAFLATSLDRRSIVAQVTRTVSEALQLESMTLCLSDDGEVWQRTADGSLRQDRDSPGTAALARQSARHATQFEARRLAASIDDPVDRGLVEALLQRHDARIVLPIVFQGQAMGTLSLGPKRSGQAFDSESIELLRTLADQTAIAIQNARAHQALADLNRDLDAQVRQRTAELQRAYEDLQSTQAQLVQSEKMASLGQLVAGVAHELNNPASFVYAGFDNIADFLRQLVRVIETYEQLPISDPAALAAIERVRRETHLDFVRREAPNVLRISSEGLERIKRIIDDLTLFARADGGERVATNVTEAIDSCLRLLGPRLRQADAQVVTRYATVPQIEANAAQLNQVWMNVLSNAIDAVAGRERREIEVRVARSGPPDGLHPDLAPCAEERTEQGTRRSRDACDETPHLAQPSPIIQLGTAGSPPLRHHLAAEEGQGGGDILITITDTGSGIASEHLPHLFEPFFTTKPIGSGTGLGLSMAYGAVKAHGGTIEVESTLETGTTVSVRLPVR